MYTKEILSIAKDSEVLGYWYTISKDGKIRIFQPYKPSANGIVYMTEEEANQFADADITNLESLIQAEGE